MPAYNSQLTSNSPLVSVGPEDVAPAIVYSAEIPVVATASLAVAIRPSTVHAGPRLVSVQFESANIGTGVFQIQDSDLDVAADYTNINFGGGTPGQVTSASVNASGVARVELQVRARFLRVLCVTAPTAAITVRISG